MTTPEADEAVIAQVELATTPDGEAALTVELRYPNGGRSRVQIGAREAALVLSKAKAATAQDLVGRSWRVLQVQTVTGPKPLPRE